MNLAGTPAHISLSGISLVITDPAPTIELAPIITGFVMIQYAPKKAFSLIVTLPL